MSNDDNESMLDFVNVVDADNSANGESSTMSKQSQYHGEHLNELVVEGRWNFTIKNLFGHYF